MDASKRTPSQNSTRTPSVLGKVDTRNTVTEENVVILTPTILIIGIGGAGNHIITRLNECKLLEDMGVKTLAIDTNVHNLLVSVADKKLAIGEINCRGLGAGKNPNRGEAAAKESIDKIRDHINADVVFLITGLGAGTGTGATPIISKVARDMGALTICICTLPFKIEGKKRMSFALTSLEQIMAIVDAIIIIPNEKLLELTPNLSMEAAFRTADDLVIYGLQAITELINKPGRINVDLADLRALFSLSKKPTGISIIWRGAAEGENRVREAIKKAMEFPFVDVDLSIAKGALINITSGPDLSLQEAQEIIQYATSNLNETAQIIWGLILDESLTDSVKVTVVISGVEVNLTNSFAE